LSKLYGELEAEFQRRCSNFD